MKSFSKTRKFVHVALATVALATAVLATSTSAHAKVCHWNWIQRAWMCS